MENAKPLPSYLLQRYLGWKATTFAENREWYRRLATEGQRPRAMVVSCCDSRVQVSSLFGADEGELFIHRNIANLVPPFAPDEDYHGTSAALEYAVTVLKVTNLIVLGHSNCGGVKGCHDMCSSDKKKEDRTSSFVENWLEILRPGFDRLDASAQGEDALRALEKQAILVSLENMMTFPFVQEAVQTGRLNLTGLWTDLGEGALEYYNAEDKEFAKV